MYIHNAEDSAEGSDSLVAKKFVYKYFLLKLVFHFHRKSPKHAVKLRMCEKYFVPCISLFFNPIWCGPFGRF